MGANGAHFECRVINKHFPCISTKASQKAIEGHSIAEAVFTTHPASLQHFGLSKYTAKHSNQTNHKTSCITR